MAKVKFEFDLYEEAEELRTFQNALNYYSALFDIWSLVRNKLKYSEEPFPEEIERLLEEIKELSGEWID